MRISIPRQDLFDAVNKVKTVVTPRTALPILSHILMEAQENSLRLTATDLKVTAECTVDCTVHEPGLLTVSSQRLAGLLAELPQRDISIALSDNSTFFLECDSAKIRLFSMSPDEFPPTRSFEGIEPVHLEEGLLKHMFWKTAFAVCTDQTRYNLTGVLFDIADGKITTVATDGRRMSVYVHEDGAPQGVAVKVIVPGKTVSELERLLGDEGETKIFIDESQAAFTFKSMRLITALIEGSFPNYDMILPKKHDKEAILSTEIFLEAVRRTRAMTNEKFNSVRFLLEGSEVTLRVITPEVGESEEKVAIQYEGPPLEIAFNPDFIFEVLKRINTERVSLLLKDGESPGIIKPVPVGETKDTYINVIMPIRI